MSADKALALAANMGFGVEVKRIMAEKGMTFIDLKKTINGVTATGRARPSGSIYEIMSGRSRATAKSIVRYAAALGVPVEQLAATYKSRGDPSPRADKYAGSKGTTEVVVKYVKPEPVIVTPVLNIVTQPDGTASLTINLHSLTILEALEIGRAVMDHLR